MNVRVFSGDLEVNGPFLFLAAFLASAIESVEMVAILIGVGATRRWRSTWLGAAVGFAVLAVLVLVLGTALQAIPIEWLRLFVGALLLIFGLQWLKKAVLRLALPWRKKRPGDLHDEVEPAVRPGSVDWYAFVIAFKGVLLEGLEIAFVVITFGAEARQIPLASVAAVTAFLAVAAVAFFVRTWVARIPREWLRFGVGILLTTFGTYWSAEGAGVHWPGGDLALVALLAIIAGSTICLLWLLKHSNAQRVEPA